MFSSVSVEHTGVTPSIKISGKFYAGVCLYTNYSTEYVLTGQLDFRWSFCGKALRRIVTTGNIKFYIVKTVYTQLVETKRCKMDIQVKSSDGDILVFPVKTLNEESDFFKGLFLSGMKESQLNEVVLPTISSDILSEMQRYIGLLSCHEQSTEVYECAKSRVEDMLNAAHFLQMNNLIQTLCHQIINQFTVKDCWKFKVLASQLYILQLETAIIKYICKHLDDFSDTGEFSSLSGQDILLLFQRDEISIEKESDIFHYLLKWFTVDSCRLGDAKEIVQSIRFGLMTTDDLIYWKEKLLSDYGEKLHKHCTPFIDNALKCEHDLFHFHNLPADQKRPRNTTQLLLTIGGFTKNEYSTNRISYIKMDELCDRVKLHCDITDTRYKNSEQSETDSASKRQTRRAGHTEVPDRIEFHQKHVKLKLPQPLCEHCVCVLDGFVYVAGGQTKYIEDGRYTTNTVYRYNLRDSSWLEVCPMQVPRSLFYMGSLGDSLYAVGGWRGPNSVSKTVERYTPAENKWLYVATLEMGLHEHAGCTQDNVMWISGGFKGPFRGHIDKLWCYNPAYNTWREKSPMIHGRSYHSMVTWNDKIVVAGGVTYLGAEQFQDVQSCEMYDTVSDQWTFFTTTPMFVSCSSHLIYKDHIFFFGGHSFLEDKDHSEIQILNIKEKTWTQIPFNANGILFFGVVVVDMSRNKFDLK